MNYQHKNEYNERPSIIAFARDNSTKIIIYISIAILIFSIGYFLGHNSENKLPSNIEKISVTNLDRKDDQGKNIDFSLFWQTWDALQKKYVYKDKIDAEKMYYGAIKGMVASVEDPYTFFMTPEEHNEAKADLQGEFEGIGAQLGLRDNRIIVVSPIDGSPAEQAGVKAGDFITKVDGDSIKGWTLMQAVSKIRGKRGTKVVLTLERKGEEKDYSITRDKIDIASVELSYEGEKENIAYLKLSQFGDNTEREWNTAVSQISEKWKSGKVTGMILDLRDNPGGYLETSVYVASEFLDGGKDVVKQESTVAGDRAYKSRRGGLLKDIPLVVMINEGSASASEILSGALRDYERATLVGMKSFGKGSVQEDINLDKNAGLRVTIAKWILPKGDWINEKGIEPDVEVKNKIEEGNTITREFDQQLNKAVEELIKKM